MEWARGGTCCGQGSELNVLVHTAWGLSRRQGRGPQGGEGGGTQVGGNGDYRNSAIIKMLSAGSHHHPPQKPWREASKNVNVSLLLFSAIHP